MPPTAERGFVLIAAMWLLLLACSIAALLMLRGMNAARDVRQASAAMADRFVVDDAIETIAAAVLINGQASAWAHLPTSGDVAVADERVAVKLDAEDSRLDVNTADLARIDDTLHDHGYSPEQRAALLARVADTRAQGHRLSSIAAIAALARGIVRDEQAICLARILSPFGGAAPQQLLPEPRQLRLGDIVRLRFQTRERGQTLLFRIVGTGSDPYAVVDSYRDTCPEASSA